jgi:bacteriorhodopsin
MVALILFPSVICINLGVFIFFTSVSQTFKIIHESLLLYINAIISLFTIIFYIFNLLAYIQFGFSRFTFMIYYMEWAIVTPLFIISLMHILRLKYKQMLILSAIDVVCMITGGIMEAIPSKNLKIISFVIGLACYIGIIAYTYNMYSTYRRIPIRSILYNNSITIYKCMSLFVVLTWNFYPIVTFLHTLEIISDDVTIIVYAVLDVISKNIYIMLIYYYVLTINNIPHWFDWFTKNQLKIVPIENIVNAPPENPAAAETENTEIVAVVVTADDIIFD